jgi:hypothetical protein
MCEVIVHKCKEHGTRCADENLTRSVIEGLTIMLYPVKYLKKVNDRIKVNH